jgi:hypothetical protein
MIESLSRVEVRQVGPAHPHHGDTGGVGELDHKMIFDSFIRPSFSRIVLSGGLPRPRLTLWAPPGPGPDAVASAADQLELDDELLAVAISGLPSRHPPPACPAWACPAWARPPWARPPWV